MPAFPVFHQSLALWDMLGGRMPRGVFGLSDPDVHNIDGRWVMFIGGFTSRFENRLYRATLDAGDDLHRGAWSVDARPLAPQPPRRAWDAGGMHTPSYVPAHLGQPPLMFYAGRASRRHYGPGSAYSIGVLRQQPDGEWARSPSPVMTGTGARPSVLEPLVIPVDDGYRMWFLATPHEVGPGEQPDFELHVSESRDGENWDAPRLFSQSSEGFFDNAVYRTPTGWAMLLARGTNLHGTVPFPEQGLWLMTSSEPSARRSDWSPPVRVLNTDDASTPGWMRHGVCGPSVAFEGAGSAVVFFTGTHKTRSWWEAALIRLRHSRRLPVAAPYFLATGSAVLG